MKKVLLVNPVAKNDQWPVPRVHMGLTLMSQLLIDAGYSVLIVDYAF